MTHADIITVNPGMKTLGALHHPLAAVTEALHEVPSTAGAHLSAAQSPARNTGFPAHFLRFIAFIMAFILIPFSTAAHDNLRNFY